MKKNGKSLALELISDLLEDLSPLEEEQNFESSVSKKAEAKPVVSSESKPDLKVVDEQPPFPKIEPQEKLEKVSSSISAELEKVKSSIVSSKLVYEVEERTQQLRAENDRLLVKLQKIESSQSGRDKLNRSLQKRIHRLVEELEQEKLVYNSEKKQILVALEKTESDLNEEKLVRQELENKLSTGVKNVRTRERELENRLEILKIESQAVSQVKDNEILQLNERVDELLLKIKEYETRSAELASENEIKEGLLKQATSELKVTLTSLENEANVLKKSVGED